MKRYRTAHIILRSAVAFSFAYAAIAAYLDPISWAGFLPGAVELLPLSKLTILNAFGVLEIVIALWLLSGVRVLVPAVLAAVLLAGIVFTNLPLFEVLFRDLALAGAAVALAVLEYRETGRVL
ncbi:MAG: hypothetical protein WD049_05060 [Candidatus Paceibacterota bacterium]